MKLELKFLSSRSGKSLVLKIENKTYLFNIFEGFQRYCIEKKQSLNSIDAFFLTSRYNVPPLMATYLSLLDCEMGNFNVISSFNVDFRTVHKFAYSEDRAPIFTNSYSDQFIKVEIVDSESEKISNFIIELSKIRGKFYPEKLPSKIPRNLYKDFISKGSLTFEGQNFILSDYSDPEIVLNKICLVFSQSDLDKLPKNVKCFFCFHYSVYKQLLELFPKLNTNSENDNKNLSGIYLISDNCEIEYESFYENQTSLYETDPRFILPYSFKTDYSNIEPSHCLKSGDCFVFNKELGFVFNPHVYKIPSSRNPLNMKYPSIQFLGTGCAIPSKLRNVSSILYQNEDHAILLDCGEDTLSQIERLFGDFEVMKKLKIVYISHLHADHMIGIAQIVKYCPNKLVIIGSDFIKEYLNYFGFFDENTANDFTFISTTPIKIKGNEYYKNPSECESMKDNFIETICVDEFIFRICACQHSKSSTSVSIFDQNCKKSFSYSGDTVPSTLFAYLSKDNNVMIHEATFETGCEDRAGVTEHTIYHEAVEIFRLSQAHQLLLTHFSNRNKRDLGEVEEEPDVKSVGDFFNYTFL